MKAKLTVTTSTVFSSPYWDGKPIIKTSQVLFFLK
jgi:hypothetical protein